MGAMATRSSEVRGGKIVLPMVVVASLGLVGCGGGGRGHQAGGGAKFPIEAAAAVALAVAHIVTVAATPAPADPNTDPDPYIPTSAPPPPPVRPPPVPSSHPSFEPAAALAAIDVMDFGPCRGAGSSLRWYHARVTYEPDGSVSRVLIDWAAGTPSSAMDCLREKVAMASVPRFEGPAVTVGASFFVP